MQAGDFLIHKNHFWSFAFKVDSQEVSGEGLA